MRFLGLPVLVPCWYRVGPSVLAFPQCYCPAPPLRRGVPLLFPVPVPDLSGSLLCSLCLPHCSLPFLGLLFLSLFYMSLSFNYGSLFYLFLPPPPQGLWFLPLLCPFSLFQFLLLPSRSIAVNHLVSTQHNWK